jgi:hypothetical protein
METQLSSRRKLLNKGSISVSKSRVNSCSYKGHLNFCNKANPKDINRLKVKLGDK